MPQAEQSRGWQRTFGSFDKPQLKRQPVAELASVAGEERRVSNRRKPVFVFSAYCFPCKQLLYSSCRRLDKMNFCPTLTGSKSTRTTGVAESLGNLETIGLSQQLGGCRLKE